MMNILVKHHAEQVIIPLTQQAKNEQFGATEKENFLLKRFNRRLRMNSAKQLK